MATLSARRAEKTDLAALEAMFDATLEQKFGISSPASIPHLIETSVLAVTIMDDKDRVIGFASFLDALPSGFADKEHALAAHQWPSWFEESYGSEFKISNTVWLTCFLSLPELRDACADRILQTAFSTLPHLSAILAFLAEGVERFDPVSTMFEALPRLDGVNKSKEHKVFACPRNFFVPPLIVRIARIEDHDDLAPIFDANSEVLTSIYGEFFLAELIENQNEHSHCLVGDVDGRAVGLMAFTDEIDVSLLRKCFDLSTYGDLLKSESQPADNRPETKPFSTTSDAENAGQDGVGDGEGEIVAVEPVEGDSNHEKQNCFSITLYCIDESFESRGIDLLRPAFDLYSNCDYCLLTLPHTAREIPLMSHMSQISPRPNNTFGQTLYLIHRDSLEAELTVTLATQKSLQHTATVLGGMDNAAKILAAASASPATSFVVCSYAQVVGVVVVEPQCGLDVLRDNFAIEDFMALQDLQMGVKGQGSFNASDDSTAGSHFALQYFVLNPLFQRQSAFVCREVLRLTGGQVLHYKVYPDSSPYFKPYQNVLNLFVQVRPRRKPQQPEALVTLIPNPYEKEAALAAAATVRDDFALHLTTRRLLSMPKAQTNARVVVVGASCCGLSLLESLLLISDLNYAHITLISPSGLPAGRSSSGGAFLPWNLFLDDRAMDRLVLQSRVKVVKGELREILCEEKQVVLQNGKRVPYDFLVLTPGMQDPIKDKTLQHILQRKEEARQRRISRMLRKEEKARLAEIAASEAAAAANESGAEVPAPLEEIAEEEEEVVQEVEEKEAGPEVPLEGVFTFSQESDVQEFLDWHRLQEAQKLLGDGAEHASPETPIVVHGSSLAALTVLRGLLDAHISPSHLLWLHDKDLNDSAWCHGDVRVARRTVKAIASLGVGIKPHTLVADLRRNASGRVTHVLFEAIAAAAKEDEPVKNADLLSCYAFIGCSEGDVNKYIFAALSTNSLVYDGRMVVDHEFKTADPFVYGAGTVAKFSRRYGQTLLMSQFDSREVGQKLAEAVLRAIDPLTAADFVREEPVTGVSALHLLPTLGVAPKTEEGLLPHGLHYFNARKPTLRPTTKSKTLSTTNGDDRACTLIFDDLNYLASISYLGSTPVQGRNLVNLIGLPASYMNRILYRYNQNEIPDLIAFLQEPWATCLYHESFSLMKDEIKLFGSQSAEFRDILFKFKQFRESKEFHMPESLMVPKLAAGLDQGSKEAVQVQLLKFLQMHSNHLPGYIVPALDK